MMATPRYWRLIDPDGDQILVTFGDDADRDIGYPSVGLSFHGMEFCNELDFKFDDSAAGLAAARLFFSDVTEDRCREIVADLRADAGLEPNGDCK